MFKKGDKVLITGNGGGFIRHHLLIGTIGEVLNPGDDSSRVEGRYDVSTERVTSQWISNMHLKKLGAENNKELSYLLESDY